MCKRLFLFLTVLFLSYGLAMAQRTVRGNVISAEDNEPIIGASIQVKGTTQGTVTDLDGNFVLEGVSSAAKQIVVSYVGMTTKTVNITNDMKIIMESDAKVLDDVVVVAYGTASAKSLTASIASVKGDALKDVPGQGIDQMLQGRAAGVMISSAGSAMGQAPTINIRGVASISNSTTPLYVVDGMPINTSNISSTTDYNPIADINPADIKSIDILKDAAATAMYGSRAAAGVVLITTNSGVQGRAKISYGYTLGINNATKLIDNMNATQYTEHKTLGRINAGLETADGPHMYNLDYDSKGNLIDTRWYDLLFRTGVSQNHNMNISGGNERSQYYIGAGYSKEDGITVGDDYERFNFKANGNIKATSWLKIGMNTSFTNSNINVIDLARGGSVYAIGGFPRMAEILPPNVASYNEDGTPNVRGGKYIGSGANKFNISYYNPMACIDNGQYDQTNTNRVLASGYAELTPVKGLTLKTQYGIDWTFSENTTFRTPNGGDGYPNGSSSFYHNYRKIWTFTNTADYKLNLGDHHINVLVGTEATETNQRQIRRSGTTLLDKDMPFAESGYGTYTGSGARYSSAMFSYISRASYDWNNRYYLTANLRRDGLSRLGRKWGNFWGVSGAWRISDEAFFKPIKGVVDDMKLKASYGVVGNTNVGWYASQSTYTTGYFNGAASMYSNAINDANLGWEQTGTFDLGLTAALLGGKLHIDLDYFNAQSKDLILSYPVAYSTGIPGASIATNMGKAENKGIEFSISGSIMERKDFSWSSTFNVSFVKNKVLSLVDDIVNDGTGANNITTEGLSMGQLYVYPTAGVDPVSGRRVVVMNAGTPNEYKALLVYKSGAKFYKLDEQAADHMGEQVGSSGWYPVISGNTKPTWYGGWTNNFRYKNWDATVFFQFSGGNKIYNGTKATLSDQRFWNNSVDVYKNSWKNPGDKATYPMAMYNDNYSNGSQNPISDWVEKGDYLRLKNVALGYNFNTKKWPAWIGISTFRLYAQIQNLFCLTSYTGMDPEVNSRADSSNLISGIDKNTTPQTRTYTIGVNVSF